MLKREERGPRETECQSPFTPQKKHGELRERDPSPLIFQEQGRRITKGSKIILRKKKGKKKKRKREKTLTIVHARHARPKLALAQPRQRKGGRRAVVRPPRPVVRRHQVGGRVRRHLQHVAGARLAAALDSANLAADGDERVGEAVELGLALRLRRLDHQRVGDGPRHGGRVEAVVLQAFGNVGRLDAGAVAQRAHVEDELVRAAPGGVRVQDGVVRRQARQQVVGVEQGDLGCVREAVAAWDIKKTSRRIMLASD